MTAREIADWLRDQDIIATIEGATPRPQFRAKIVPDDSTAQGEIIAQPDRLIAVQMLPGAGLLGEGVRDRPAAQVIVRGMQKSDDDASNLAKLADDALIDAEPPLSMGDTHVIAIDRFGGAPGFLRRDESGRLLLTATYMFQIAR